MKGKAGLVIGLAAGYILGSRAGRERCWHHTSAPPIPTGPRPGCTS